MVPARFHSRRSYAVSAEQKVAISERFCGNVVSIRRRFDGRQLLWCDFRCSDHRHILSRGLLPVFVYTKRYILCPAFFILGCMVRTKKAKLAAIASLRRIHLLPVLDGCRGVDASTAALAAARQHVSIFACLLRVLVRTACL